MVVDDGSSAMVMKALIVASKRAEEHQKRSPESKYMAKTIFRNFQFSAGTAGGGGSTAGGTAGSTREPFSAVPLAVVPVGAVVPLGGR